MLPGGHLQRTDWPGTLGRDGAFARLGWFGAPSPTALGCRMSWMEDPKHQEVESKTK